MNVRVCILVSLLVVFCGILIHVSVGYDNYSGEIVGEKHSLGVPDSELSAPEASKVVPVKSPEQNKHCIMTRNTVVSWKSEINGNMMKASLSQEETEKLGALMASGQTVDESLGQLQIAVTHCKK